MWNRIIKTINKVTESVCMIFMVVMVLIVFVQIVSRVIVHSSFSWTEELARYIFIWTVLLGSSLGFYYWAHVSIDMVVKLMPLSFRRLTQALVMLICSSISVIMIIKGCELVSKSMMQTSSSLLIPMGYVYIILPVSGVLLILNVLDATIKFWSKGEGVSIEE